MNRFFILLNSNGRRKRMTVVIIAAFLLSVFSYYWYFQRSTEWVNRLGPRDLIQTYYKSIAMHNKKVAIACLAPEYRLQVVGSDDWEGRNVLLLSELKISGPHSIALNNSNYKELQLTADYEVTYKHVITENSGHSTRFIYVGKKYRDSSWKIISIGTGP